MLLLREILLCVDNCITHIYSFVYIHGLSSLFTGWQPGIQECAADWDEDWDKLEEEGILAV